MSKPRHGGGVWPQGSWIFSVCWPPLWLYVWLFLGLRHPKKCPKFEVFWLKWKQNAPSGALGAPVGPFWAPKVPRDEKVTSSTPPQGSTLAPKMKPKTVQKTHEKTCLKKEASRVHFGGQNGPKINKNWVICGVAFCNPFFEPSTSKKITKIWGFLVEMGATCSLHSVLGRKSIS